MSTECHLLNCPAEVLLLIARYLSTPDLASFVKTNRTFYTLGIPVLWSHFYFKASLSSAWYVNPQEILEEQYLGLKPSQRPPLHSQIREICRQRSTARDPSVLSTISLPSPSLSSCSDEISSIINNDYSYDTFDSTITSFTSSSLTVASDPIISSHIDYLSLALLQNTVSQLATSSIRSLIISTDYRFGQLDRYTSFHLGNNSGYLLPERPMERPASLSFVEFLKHYLLTPQTVPNLQHLCIIHTNPASPLALPATISSSEGEIVTDNICISKMASVVGEFLQKFQNHVRLSLDCATLVPVQAVLNSTPKACQLLHFLHVDVFPSQYHLLAKVLDQTINLKVLSVKSSDVNFSPHTETEHTENTNLDLFFAACRRCTSLCTLTLKAVSLVKFFTPEYLPSQLTHLELEADFHLVHSTISHYLFPSTAEVVTVETLSGDSNDQIPQNITSETNLWEHIFSGGNFGQLETLKVRLWNIEMLFPAVAAAVFPSFRYPNNQLVVTGNLREVHLDGDCVPPGLDAFLFATNPKLQRVKIPVIYGSGAYALASNCPELEELTVFGTKPAGAHSAGTPDFLECRLLRLLVRCRRLHTLYLNTVPRSIRGGELLALLRACPQLSTVTIEQTNFDLPHYKAVINEDENDEFGGFGMLPLEIIKQRLPLYNQLRTTFLVPDSDKTRLCECLAPIDGYEATRIDPEYKQYYSTLAYQRYNCIFNLDIAQFLALNADK